MKTPFITEKIRELLKEKNISQNELARKVGYKHGPFGNFVRGEKPFPAPLIPKIATILEVSEDDIEGWILADKYSKEVLQTALQVKQEFYNVCYNYNNIPYETLTPIFAAKIYALMEKQKLNITAFSSAIHYNQGMLSQVVLGKEPISENLIQKLHNYTCISKEEITSWAVADKYSAEALQVAIKSL